MNYSIKKILTVTCFTLFSSSAIAGIPVLDEASATMLPLSYVEELNTQLNTINQYEQQLIDYENQYRQLENMIMNSNFDQYKITQLSDLRNHINAMRGNYTFMIDKYNTFAEKINKHLDENTDAATISNSEVAQAKASEELHDTIEEMKSINSTMIDNLSVTKEGSAANLIEKDLQKINEMAAKKASRTSEKDGSNQILSDTRELNQLTNEQLVKLRAEINEINNSLLEQKRDRLEQKAKNLKYINEKVYLPADSWKNKKFKDEY